MKTVKQNNDYDCILACLASYVGGEIDDIFQQELIADINNAKTCTGDNIDKAFKSIGLDREVEGKASFYSHYVPQQHANSNLIKKLLYGRNALLQVPSLNYENSSHMVMWDGERLFDPSNKQVYYWLSQVHLEHIFLLP